MKTRDELIEGFRNLITGQNWLTPYFEGYFTNAMGDGGDGKGDVICELTWGYDKNRESEYGVTVVRFDGKRFVRSRDESAGPMEYGEAMQKIEGILFGDSDLSAEYAGSSECTRDDGTAEIVHTYIKR